MADSPAAADHLHDKRRRPTTTTTPISPKSSRKRSRRHHSNVLENNTIESQSNGKVAVVPSPTTTTNNEASAVVVPLPTRDCCYLWTSAITIQCAIQHHCIPCAYKVGCFDVALDSTFCRSVPNQRPENCPRNNNIGGYARQPCDTSITSRKSNDKVMDHTAAVLGYQRGMKILTVGDGDFSFSLALARLLLSSTTTTTRKTQIIATTYESLDTLRRVYPNLDDTLQELQQLGVVVVEQVDATRLPEGLPSCDNNKDEQDKHHYSNYFHRIVWNFPCTAVPGGQDGQNDAMDDNKELVRKFVRSAMHLLAPGGGEIHMCHKTKPPFDQWRLEQVVMEAATTTTTIDSQLDLQQARRRRTDSNVQDNIDDSMLQYDGRVVFDKAILHPYTPRKALCRKSFPCHDACIYIFRRCITTATTAPTDGLEESENASLFSPTIPNNGNSSQPHMGNVTHICQLSSQSIVPVTKELIHILRSHVLTNAKYTHQTGS